MDNGPPNSKRARVDSGSWANGHSHARSVLPPPNPHGTYPPPPQSFGRTVSQGNVHQIEERRRHEPEFPPPGQDPRPHAVAPHPYQPFPSPREPMIKRDQSAEPAPIQYHRPHSTGDIADGLANSYVPDDPRRPSISYENTPAPPVTTQSYRPPPSYASPMYVQPNTSYERQPYEPPPTPGGLRDQIPVNITYTSSSGPGYNRRKAPRTSQACDACRQAKAKCDDPKPCSSCKEKDIECVWKTPEPKHGDKVQAEILETLRTVLDKVDSLQSIAAPNQAKINAKFKRVLMKLKPELEADLLSEEGEDDVKKEHMYDGLHGSEAAPRHASTPEPPYRYEYGQESLGDPEDDEEAGRVVLPGEPTIPVGHTTGAARLLLWPAVERFLGERLRDDKMRSLEQFVEYPNVQENKHGLRLYGRGPGSSRALSADGSPDDGFSDVSSSPGPESVYGQIGGLTPPPGYPTAFIIRRAEERRGGVHIDGQLELDEPTVDRLVESYLAHMHKMHPILDPRELRENAKKFVKLLPPSNSSSKPKVPVAPMEPPKFVNSGADTPGSKRKRSPITTGELPDVSVPYPLKPGRPQRSIRTAILLLVLGLGRICEHREKVPYVLPDHESPTNGSPHLRSGFPSPMLASPVVSSQSSGLPSPQEADRARHPGRRASTESYQHPRSGPLARNLDVIPGLAYVAFATDILGNEIGENSLQHVHAHILASLYFGQLARPIYSHRLIINASLGLQMILRLKLDRLRKYKPNPDAEPPVTPEKVPKKDNPLIFAFWTCLQLESDILAELDLPHSGITTLETHMPWPNLEVAKDNGRLTAIEAESYQAQLYLRNHLNSIHQKVYGVGQMGKSLEEDYKLPMIAQNYFPVIEAMVDSIPKMSRVAPSMNWDDEDPPAKEILAARLRAKYYGTEVITYRPFLKMVMNRPSRLSNDVPHEDIPPKILNYTKLCIRAMENSTKAFHGMEGGRLIITNVWGTAHAQWGNVILLQTAYQDPLLKQYIDKENLRTLVTKTLKFLREVADPQSALMTDIRILEFAAHSSNLTHDPTSSFSSHSEPTPQNIY